LPIFLGFAIKAIAPFSLNCDPNMQSSSGNYRIIDEGFSPARKAPPWNPGALFALMIVAGIFAQPFAPLFGLFFAFNWARLGQPEKRLPTLLVALLLFALPFLLAAFEPQSKENMRTIIMLGRLAFAFYFEMQQRPFFAQHLARGGQGAPVMPLWALAAALSGVWWWTTAK
jgi:hypothetical protein